MHLKTCDYLSHNIKKNEYIDSSDRAIDSGLGTVSTWISSQGYFTMKFLSFPLEYEEIVIILHEGHMESFS